MSIQAYFNYTDNFLKEESKQYIKKIAYSKVIGKVELIKDIKNED